MFNVGGGELIVILLIALIVLGPQRLPDAARQIGKTMGELRRLSTGFQNEMRSALDSADDPTRVAARRNVLAKEEPPVSSGTDRPVRTEPLVAGPGLEPRPNELPAAPPKTRPPSAQARAAAKKQATAKKPVTAKNGTPVKKTAKKAAPPRAKP
jgi:sec-independent protein translocase protein TatB